MALGISRTNATKPPADRSKGISLNKCEPENELSRTGSSATPPEQVASIADRWTPPFMPWFEQDFQGSQRVRRLKPEARWIYGDLLRAGWHCDSAPYLPNDPEELRAICDCPPRYWKKHSEAVMACFSSTTDGKLLYHPKVVKEFNRAIEEHQRKVAAGKSRWGKPIAEGPGPQIHSHDHIELHVHNHAPKKDHDEG